MELRQLKYFVEVARCCSFSEASRVCYLSQSAISQQIKALEDELDAQLFVRTPHKVELTESGERFLPYARKVLKDMADCESCIEGLKDDLSGELVIGMTYSLETYVRNTAVEFLKAYPKMKLNVIYKNIPELIQMLREQQVDVVFSVSCDGSDDMLNAEPLMDYKMCAVMRSINPLCSKGVITLSDLEQQYMVMPEGVSFVRSIGLRYFKYDVSRLNIRATVNQPSSIVTFVKQTDYVSILPEHFVAGMKDVVAVPVKELSTPITCYSYTLKNSCQKRSLKMFLEMLKNTISVIDYVK